MKGTLADYVQFRGDRLFDGAVDVSWLINHKEKAECAAAAYIFHGPEYHGVSQEDVGSSHGHRLIDTASFTQQIIQRCNAIEDKPFTLAIAGYGTGKSHLATTLATLLSNPNSTTSSEILRQLERADSRIYESVRAQLSLMAAPALVVTLNGMGNFDLATEFTRQILFHLQTANINTQALEALRPRFKTAENLIARLTSDERKIILEECGISEPEEIIKRLHTYDESIYTIVQANLAKLGFTIKAIGDETVTDVIETVCREYVGEGRPYSKLVIVFDEFGRYAEFATVRSQIAGNGVLQQLYEGVQSNSSKAIFIGFIQFDLNVYVQRIGQEYRNEILRVSTRYQSSEKAYLSINLETLLANLLEKKDRPALDTFFEGSDQKQISKTSMEKINTWLPLSKNHRLWSELESFHKIICKGCWPLSPYAAWLLFYLAAGGQHLQQRSALALLSEALLRSDSAEVESYAWVMEAVDLWSDSLESELLIAEESGSKGAITHAYSSAISKVGQHLTYNEVRVLRGIVLTSKLGATTKNRFEAIECLAALTGINQEEAEQILKLLEDERNIISWDERFNQYEITGDTVTRPQFLALLRKKVNDNFGKLGRSQLFLYGARLYCPEIIRDCDCDFSENHKITTPEWLFAARVTTFESLEQTILEAADNWKTAMMIDQPRGSVIYCYLEPESDVQQIKLQTQAFLQKMAREKNQKVFPILVIFFADRDGIVGQTLAEMTILEKNLDSHEKQQFGNLIENHKAKCITLLSETMRELALERQYVFLGAPDNLESANLKNVCSLLFENVYPHVLPFPFDGFASSRGNAADTCYSLTLELISGHMTYDDIMRKPPKEKNRAIEVLNQCWNVFLPTGDISRTPANLSLNSIFGIWEKQINNEDNIVTMADLILTACRPPFGANIPSSGLALGVFLCARQKNLALKNHGKDIYLSEISAEMLFHGKNLDLDKLKYMVIIPSEEKISEWEAFLDAWEAAGKISYKDQIDYYDKSIALKEKVRPPKEQTYRLELLEDQSKKVKEKVESTEIKVERIARKLEETGQYDLHELSFCAVKIKEILDLLRSDLPLARLFDIKRMQEDIDEIRQQSIQTFPDWIKRQSPRGRTTRDASDFSKYMRETSSNMRKLSLNELADAIDEKTLEALRQIDTLAEAQNLYENALSWLKANINKRAPRITDLRDAIDTAKGYLKEAVDVQSKIQTPDIDSLIEQLNIFITETRAEEEKIKDKFVKTMDWDFNLGELNDMITKLNGFFEIFQGSEKDLEEIRSMQEVLGFYRSSLVRICSEHLTDTELFALFSDIEQEVRVYDEAEPLWISEDVLPILFKEAERKRYESGERWLESINQEIAQLKELTVGEASILHDRIQKYPPYLTSVQREKALKNSQQIEQHLNSLKVKWLIQKFKELDDAARKIFLNIILSEPHD